MASRPDYDYSMWPEHARPRGRRLSLKFVAGAFAAGVVCTIAAGMVYSEFADTPLAQRTAGRAWPLAAPVDESRAAGNTAAGAVDKTAAGPASDGAPKPADPACDPQKSPYGIDPCARAAQSETTGSAPSAARAAKPAAVMPPSRRGVTLPAIGTPSVREEAAVKPADKPVEKAAEKAAPPAVAASRDEQAASLRKELDAAATEEAKPQDKPKPRKKARRKPDQRLGDEAGVTARVYDLPDGRRITVIRRNPEYQDYGRPAPNYYASPGRPGYYQY